MRTQPKSVKFLGGRVPCAAWLLGSLVLACGASSQPAEAPQPVSTVIAPAPSATSSQPVVTIVEAPPPQSRGPFPDSAITPLAHELIQVVQAALRGDPLPKVSFPIEAIRDQDRVVSGDKEALPRELEFIAFAMELEFSLGPRGTGANSGPGGGAPDGIELALFLSRHGLKIIELKADQVSNAIPAPSWLPVDALAQEILADVQGDRMTRWWLGDAEKQLFGPELTAEIERNSGKQPDRLRKAQQRVAGKTRVHGFRIDDVTLIVRDPRGEFWALRMQFESGDTPELDAHPVVRVRRAKRD